MESERSIRTCNSTGATTELFLCFTSRLSSSSSSSMKISSKSILSPGRPGDQPITLSTSLSRRLRTNGSIKGAQSPMFPNIAGKKRGSAFENPEPSSPKVTCIGQVRVKTKKQGRKMRTLSSRRCTTGGNDAAGGDVSFRQVGTATDHSRQRNQRWVHLPLTICEALRGIGADLNCLFPCRSSSPSSSCFSGGERNPKSSSCGAVFERWFVTIEGEKGSGREIELVVGEEEDETEKSLRREHPLEKFNEDDEARVSICIPPKNALLLMRCRSDPVKMAALSTRLFEKEEDIHEEEQEQEHEEEKEEASENEVSVQDADAEKTEIMKEDENEGSGYSSEADAELEKLLESEEEEEDERRKSHDFSLLFSVESNLDNEDEDEKTEDPLNGVQEPGEASSAAEEIETSTTHEMSESDKEEEEEEREDQRLELSEEKEIPVAAAASEEKKTPAEKILPDCLLLMMCEPKLSMEVSKETWVCSTDFIRSIPDHRRRPVEKPLIAGGVPADQKKRVNKNIPPLPPPPSQVAVPPRNGSAVLQPPRSSCTLPSTTAMSMAAMIEQKLINAVGYEPFVLTRCKSEPMRTAVAKVTPESCFWKNRKLEPLRRATMGVGAAGIGF
ncbi:F-actin-monooxygenase MICAL3-like [Impatiens glandulifera]|uniref:F-actin-monooxygenase MICAL3-like n=1 Tax=Impatiens glandulifera TaxID=253017 RepID=UPI001FB07D94|nr:F-actin-monooxygenase MICAL3-like [Impatiens glandulifera]